MVTRKTTRSTRVARRATAPTPAARALAAALERPMPNAQMRLDRAGRALRTAGKAATRLARSSMREMTTAARESREPIQALWRNVRLAGRHIVRDVRAAWCDMVPAATPRKPARVARRQAM